jgi:hypothetical protein
MNISVVLAAKPLQQGSLESTLAAVTPGPHGQPYSGPISVGQLQIQTGKSATTRGPGKSETAGDKQGKSSEKTLVNSHARARVATAFWCFFSFSVLDEPSASLSSRVSAGVGKFKGIAYAYSVDTDGTEGSDTGSDTGN